MQNRMKMRPSIIHHTVCIKTTKIYRLCSANFILCSHKMWVYGIWMCETLWFSMHFADHMKSHKELLDAAASATAQCSTTFAFRKWKLIRGCQTKYGKNRRKLPSTYLSFHLPATLIISLFLSPSLSLKMIGHYWWSNLHRFYIFVSLSSK